MLLRMGIWTSVWLWNFRRGRHLYSAGRPSRWASPHIVVIYLFAIYAGDVKFRVSLYTQTNSIFVTSAKEVMFSSLFVCLSACLFAQKLPNAFAWHFQGRLAMGPVNKWLNFGGDPDHRLHTGIVFRIRHYWETTLQCTGCTRRYRHSNYDVITLPVLAEVCTVPVLLVSVLWLTNVK